MITLSQKLFKKEYKNIIVESIDNTEQEKIIINDININWNNTEGNIIIQFAKGYYLQDDDALTCPSYVKYDYANNIEKDEDDFEIHIENCTDKRCQMWYTEWEEHIDWIETKEDLAEFLLDNHILYLDILVTDGKLIKERN